MSVSPRLAPFRGNAQGKQQGRRHVAPTEGGVQHTQRGGCNSTPAMFPPAVFGFFVLDRPTRTAPAVQGRTGATPPFSPLARHGDGGGASPGATPGATPPPAFGRVAPVSMYPCRKAPRPACGPDDEPRRAAPCLTDSSARSWSSAA